jgi:chemotaxis methyl-accepting protein methylase
MITFAHEKNFFQLLHKYLTSNNLLRGSVPQVVFVGALTGRAQEHGFRDVESYCHFVLRQPFAQMLQEVKQILLACQPLSFFQSKAQLESLSSRLIAGIGDRQKERAKRQDKNLHSKIFKILTSEVEFSKAPDIFELSVLCVEAAGGEEAYSAAMRIHSVLPEKTVFKVIATEPDTEITRKAVKGAYPQAKLSLVSDNYRSLYTETTRDGQYQVTDELRKKVEFRRVSLLCPLPSEEYTGQFHLIFSGNVHRFYPPAVARQIIQKLAPFLSPDGYLFASAGDAPLPRLEGLDVVKLDKGEAYRAADKPAGAPAPGCIDWEQDTIENQLFRCKVQILGRSYNDAMAALSGILHSRIDDAPANHLKGDLYALLGERDKAAGQYKKTILIQPGFLPARLNLAALHLMEDRLDEAEKELSAFFEMSGSMDDSFLLSSFNLGREALLEIGKKLMESVQAGELLEPEDYTALIDSRLAERMEPPQVVIPDRFESADTPAAAMPPDSPPKEQPQGAGQAKKVVHISQLPSTRDYGDDDPWMKKKQQDEDEKKKEEELTQLFDDYKGTLKDKPIPVKKKRKRKSAKKPGPSWADLTGQDVKADAESGKDPKKPKTLVIIKSKKPKDGEKEG